MAVVIRPATEEDLPALQDIVHAIEVRDAPHQPAPPRGDLPPDLFQVLRTGTLRAAVDGDTVIGFAGAITRDGIAFLTDLFVHPEQQSAGAGRGLLRSALAGDARVRCTVSSTDPRALALYMRAGMRPVWPHFNLLRNGPLPGGPGPGPGDVEIEEARASDPEIPAWDARIGGRSRPQDHAYWRQEQRAVPLWCTRRGARIGYAYARPGAGSFWQRDAWAIGPIGAVAAADAAACALAAVAWAERQAAVLLIDVPGPHPALAPLLAAGFQITYVETYLSDEDAPFFDPRCYIASGSTLF